MPLTVRGSAEASGPGAPQVAWTFGDGGTAVGPAVTHTYTLGTLATAVVDGQNSLGDRASESYGIDALGQFSVAGGPSETAGAAPLSVAFSVLGTGGSGPPYTYAWTVGDGGVSNASDPEHTYTGPGTYAATVTVTDSAGARLTSSWTITVTGTPPFSPAWLGAIAAAVGVGAGLTAFFRTRPTARPGAPSPP